jgi:tRNA G18 (ribose-2'-O)-methylase SpoU
VTFERSHEPGEFYVAAGVGPHPLPWPTGSEFDQDLLRDGDRRNIADEFRYLTVEAIRDRLAQRRSAVHVAIENWQHDLNIGSLVRTANAFNVAAVHIVGNKHWNQRGALMTDKYLEMHHHESAASLREFADAHSLQILAFDNVAGALPIDQFAFPRDCILLFGNEGLGLSDEALEISDETLEITQFGSVRSINASAAGAIGLFAWTQQHRPSR